MNLYLASSVCSPLCQVLWRCIRSINTFFTLKGFLVYWDTPLVDYPTTLCANLLDWNSKFQKRLMDKKIRECRCIQWNMSYLGWMLTYLSSLFRNLPYTRYFAKQFRCILCKSVNDTLEIALLVQFYRWGNWTWKRLILFQWEARLRFCLILSAFKAQTLKCFTYRVKKREDKICSWKIGRIWKKKKERERKKG